MDDAKDEVKSILEFWKLLSTHGDTIHDLQARVSKMTIIFNKHGERHLSDIDTINAHESKLDEVSTNLESLLKEFQTFTKPNEISGKVDVYKDAVNSMQMLESEILHSHTDAIKTQETKINEISNKVEECRKVIYNHETKIEEINVAIGEICSIQQDVQTHQIENNNKSNIEKFEAIKTRINEMTDILNANGSAINNLETKINEMTDILNANGEVINTQKTDYIVLQSKINSMIDDMNSFASVGNDQIGKITNLEEGVTQIVDQLNTMSVRVRLIGKTINIRETLEKESFNLLMGGNVGSDSEKTPEEQKATDEHNEYLKKLYEREAERIFADDDDDEEEATEPDSNEETRK